MVRRVVPLVVLAAAVIPVIPVNPEVAEEAEELIRNFRAASIQFPAVAAVSFPQKFQKFVIKSPVFSLLAQNFV